MGAQLCLPLHHNNARARGEDLNEYFAQVNEILKSHGSAARGPGVSAEDLSERIRRNACIVCGFVVL